MKAQPKLLSVLLSLILAIGLMPLPAFAGDAIVAGDSEILAETLATQSAAHTQAEAVAWAQARANEHWEINDGSGWTQCTEFVWAYYDYLRGGHVGGHAYNYLSDSYGACPYSEGWTRPATSTVQPGDIVIWDANKNFRADWTDYAGNVGHIGVVISVNGNSMVTAESNAGEARGACGYKYNREVSCISGLIRPDWPGDTRTIPTGSEMSSGYDRTIPNGDYAIVMSSTLTADRLYYLDISGADYPAADLTNISIYSTTGKPQDLPGCDLWSVKYQDGFYTITQKGTGISLDVNGGSVNIDSNVQACFSNGTPAQRWAISKNGDGYRLQAKCSGYSLDVEGGTVADGTNVQVHSSNDTAAQRWSFVPVDDLCQGCERTIPDGDYAIALTSTLGSGLLYYLDISGVDLPAASYSNVAIHSTTGKPQDLPGCDLWSVKYQDGFYAITQKGTSMALDVASSSIDNNANVHVWPSNGTPAQRWAISKNGDGYRLQAKCSGYSLDVEGGTVADGTNVQVHSSNDTAAQRWSFVPTIAERDGSRNGENDPDDEGEGDAEQAIDIAAADITGVKFATYTGRALEQNPTVTIGGATLQAGVDYTLSYANNVNAGTATVTVTGKGSYTGSKSATFTISPASLAAATVTVADQAYTGSSIEPAVSVTLGGKTLVQGTDYKASFDREVREAGNYTVSVSGIGNYTGTATGSFKVVAADTPSIADAVVSGLSEMAYTGEQLRPVPTVTLGGKTLTAGADYEVTYGENVRGQGSVYIWGVGSYIGSKLVTFDIVDNEGSDEGEDYEGEDTDGSDDGDDEGVYDLADADVYNVASRVYTGKAQVQSPTVLLDGMPLDEGDDYVISYKNNVNAGNATMTLEGVGAYTGSQSLTFTISKASVKGSTAAKVAAKKYTGKAIKPNPKLTFKGMTLQKGKDYTLAYKNNKKRGTATITVKGKGNFKGSKAVKFKIK